MPRKTPGSAAPTPAPAPRFNEAAARCRGKRTIALDAPQVAAASMRPRPDAAENWTAAGSTAAAVSNSLQ